MTGTYSGGCACGAIRFETDGAPLFQNHCQCRDCQKRSGTGHGSYLTFPARAEMKITGSASSWRVSWACASSSSPKVWMRGSSIPHGGTNCSIVAASFELAMVGAYDNPCLIDS